MNPGYLILSYLSTKRKHAVEAARENASRALQTLEDGGALATFEVLLSGLIFIEIKISHQKHLSSPLYMSKCNWQRLGFVAFIAFNSCIATDCPS